MSKRKPRNNAVVRVDTPFGFNMVRADGKLLLSVCRMCSSREKDNACWTVLSVATERDVYEFTATTKGFVEVKRYKRKP